MVKREAECGSATRPIDGSSRLERSAVDFSGRNRAFIKHTLLYYINDIDSEKHNQSPVAPLSSLRTYPSDHCGRVYGMLCLCVCVISRTHPHARADPQPLLYVPSLDSRNERFLINIGWRLFFANLSPSRPPATPHLHTNVPSYFPRCPRRSIVWYLVCRAWISDFAEQ